MTARIYRPTHIRQRATYAGKLIGCSETSTAMLADAVSMGAVKLTEIQSRSLSSEPHPDPASPGLNIPQCLGILRKLRIVGTFDATGRTWSQFVDDLQFERRCLVQLYQGVLTGRGKTVPHMVLVQAYRSIGFLINNPLDAANVWVSPERLRAAMTTYAADTGVPNKGLRYAASKAVPRVGVVT